VTGAAAAAAAAAAAPHSFQEAAAHARRLLILPGARPSSSVAVPFTAAEVASTYAKGLAAGVAREQHKWVADTVLARDRTVAEFREWIERLTSITGLTMHSVVPHDIEVFMETAYPDRHTGRCIGADGEPAMSFSAVKGFLAHLKTGFDLLGRSGPWNEATRQGNPCDSVLISTWRSGYEREQDGLGNVAVGARPMTLEKLRALIDAVDRDLASLPATDVMGRLLLHRDASYFTFLFASHQRGGEGAEVVLEDLAVVPLAGAAPSSLWPDWATRLPEASALVLLPHGLKNRQLRAECDPVEIAADRAHPLYCCVSRLRTYLSAMQAAGQLDGLVPSDAVYRTQARGGARQFTRDSFNYAAARGRLQTLLKKYQLFEGETLHSFRRGSAQAFTGSDEELQRRMNLNSTAVLDLYKSKHRKVRCALPATGEPLRKRGRPPNLKPAVAAAAI